MNRIGRQLATTVLAVALFSGAPLAQAPAPRGPGGTRLAAPPTGDSRVREIVRTADAENLRQQLQEILRRHPPSLVLVLRLDPTLLTNADYLAPYPELATFLAQQPEVAHNPAYYVGTPDSPWERNARTEMVRVWENVAQGLMIVFVFSTITGVIVWFVRTLVEHRRWLRLTRVHTETHTKLLDRLTTQEDLLAYMQTPAGRRFLEAAPISVETAPTRPLGAPFSRVLWSAQAGVVFATVGAGLLLVSRRAIPEVASGLWGIGILVVALGVGFAVSAGVAYFLSHRLGLLSLRAEALDPMIESGLPRRGD
jgi:hypothetical protein